MRWRGKVRPDYGVHYDGSWTRLPSELYYGGAIHTSAVPGNSVSFKFKGSSISLIGITAPGNGMADISLDGGAPRRISCYSATTVNSATLFSQTGLAAGDHTLTAKVVGWMYHLAGATGDFVTIDRFVVDGTNYDDDGLPYTFYTQAADGAELVLAKTYIDGGGYTQHSNPVAISDWFLKTAPTEHSDTVQLLRDDIPMQLSYFHATGSASVKLLWSNPFEAKGPIPVTQLFPEVSSAPIPVHDGSNGCVFDSIDTKTQGNWKGVYGADGYNILGIPEKYPPYVTVTTTAVRVDGQEASMKRCTRRL